MAFGFSATRIRAAALATWVCALLISACGGGGGSTPTAPPPASNPDPNPNPPPASTLITNPPRNCETQGDFTLCVTNHDTRTKPQTVAHMTQLFFDVYPRLVERFNAGAPRTVEFSIGPASFIAGASGNEVRYQTEWLLNQPEDYDVVVHEIAHKLDGLHDEMDGAPRLHVSEVRGWAKDFQSAYDALRADLQARREPPIDPYAGESPAEFFAVCSEYWFTAPGVLRAAYPAVAARLAAFYGPPPITGEAAAP
jgi:hypothetical protein